MRIHSLDGLRAIAVSCVVIGHLANKFGWGIWVVLGSLGVHIFFVISGFLITTLLLQEEAAHGNISLPRFWVRRALRILPAYLAYVLVAILISVTSGTFVLSRASVIEALTFTTGCAQIENWELGHLWSLAVEMQFYLFWPLYLVFYAGKHRWALVLLLICSAPIARGLIYRWSGPGLMHASVCNFDSIMIGCLLALALYEWLDCALIYWARMRVVILSASFALTGVCSLLSWYHVLGFVTIPFGNSVLAVGLAAILLDTQVRQNGMICVILNNPGLIWLGSLSYSIYLWQQMCLRPGGIGVVVGSGPWLDHPIVSIACILGLSVSSYYGLERPLTRFRNQFR